MVMKFQFLKFYKQFKEAAHLSSYAIIILRKLIPLALKLLMSSKKLNV